MRKRWQRTSGASAEDHDALVLQRRRGQALQRQRAVDAR